MNQCGASSRQAKRPDVRTAQDATSHGWGVERRRHQDETRERELVGCGAFRRGHSALVHTDSRLKVRSA